MKILLTGCGAQPADRLASHYVASGNTILKLGPLDADKDSLRKTLGDFGPELILHTSHTNPLKLLEAARNEQSKAVMIFLSSYLIYLGSLQRMKNKRLPLRYELEETLRGKGIDETISVDDNSPLTSIEKLWTEYAESFKLRMGIFRLGGLSMDLENIVEHAISHKIYSITSEPTYVIDYLVMEDLVSAIDLFRKDPNSGEIYNLGGGFENSQSIRELTILFKKEYDLHLKTESSKNGIFAPPCYYTNLQKFQQAYPSYHVTPIKEIMTNFLERRAREVA